MSNLTEQQKEAIQKSQGPCVILAGAGTGKTFTIIEKIKNLIKNKIYEPEKIVCITFSNEAANSLQLRVQRTIEKEKVPIIRTFHSFSSDLLREHGDKISIDKQFRILTPDEAKVVLHSQLKVPAGNCHRYISAIGTAKDLGIEISEIQENINKKSEKYSGTDLQKRLESLQFEFQTLHLKKGKDKHTLAKEIKDLSSLIKTKKFLVAWNAYEKIKQKSSYQDYSDLNKNALVLLKKHPEIANDYSYFIIDEFQDTNKVQLDMLFHLAPHGNITIVGDLNQSIYRFRGAYNKNLDEFKSHFKVQKTFNLAKSHRSSNKILRLAHKLIINNYASEDECFLVENAHAREGEKVQALEMQDGKEEARKVVEIIEKEISSGTNPNEICVMFRNHNYGRIIRRMLEFKKIPYCAVSKASLLDQKSVKTIINYLKVIEKIKSKGKGSEQAWWELIHSLNIDSNDLVKIGQYIRKYRELENLSAVLLNNLETLDLNTSSKLSIKILIERIKLMLSSDSENLEETIKNTFNFSGLINQEEKEVLLNLNKFYELAINSSTLYGSNLPSFLIYLDTLKELQIEVESPEIESNGVRLMTLHSTKGLEYETVILTNLAQKRFPMEKISNNSLIPVELFPEFRNIPPEDVDYVIHEQEKKHQLHEERRLCYVAFTRAKKNLILTYAKKYGEKEFFPSQFLQEIKYKNNPDIEFTADNELKYVEPEIELKPAFSFSSLLGKQNFDSQLIEIIKSSEKTSPLEQKEITFSPSSLILFSECQKKYEYKYKFNMPEEKKLDWAALRLGSFIHHVLDQGVKNNFKTLDAFLHYARELNLKEDWESVNLEEAEPLIKIFFERNKYKFNENSKTEQKLFAEFDGMKFMGFADRIDIHPEGIEIIDYKTGASPIPPKSRNWQLGFYALAAQKIGKVKKITLDMLKQEKPLEFAVDENGNAKSTSGRMEFNINKVKEELIEEAKKIIEAAEKGFKPCPIEKNCDFCNEYIYNL